MKLKVLGSGSKGNCYLLESEEEILIIELGISLKDIMQAIDFNLNKVVGALVTHEHGDHAKSVHKALEKGIKVICTQGTFDAITDEKSYFYKRARYRQEYKVGSFYIVPFRTQHDAAEPCGYLIRHKEMGTLLFATDTYYLEYRFKGINHWLVECNYSKEILEENKDKGYIHPSLADRLTSSHFSLENVKQFFSANDLTVTKGIMLIHLSDGNSNARQFKKDIEELTNRTTYIADKGIEIDLSLCPF